MAQNTKPLFFGIAIASQNLPSNALRGTGSKGLPPLHLASFLVGRNLAKIWLSYSPSCSPTWKPIVTQRTMAVTITIPPTTQTNAVISLLIGSLYLAEKNNYCMAINGR